MKKYTRQKDDWGQDIIYVEECTKYEYEDPDLPRKKPSTLHKKENVKNERICDIMKKVENYAKHSGNE